MSPLDPAAFAARPRWQQRALAYLGLGPAGLRSKPGWWRSLAVAMAVVVAVQAVVLLVNGRWLVGVVFLLAATICAVAALIRPSP